VYRPSLFLVEKCAICIRVKSLQCGGERLGELLQTHDHVKVGISLVTRCRCAIKNVSKHIFNMRCACDQQK